MPAAPARLLLSLVCACVLIGAATTVAGAAPSLNSAFIGTPIRSVYLRAPRGAANSDKPLQVLVALHGMGGNGEDFTRDLIEQADRYGWLIVAPTMAYGDYMNPNVVAQEDPVLIRALSNYLDQLPQITGMNVRRRILLLGHSRGAQLAHRFAEFQPDRVLAVAALSAGSYTLPSSVGAFPYGIKDLARYAGRAFDAASFDAIQFWVGVGGQDTNALDVPRQWDAYEGKTRVQRAQAFESAMQQLGATSVLRVFSDAKHDVTGDMRTAACTFLERAVQPRAPLGSPLSSSPRSL
jgi:pimeloyl-ACP methyl ester carboxylesterase